VVLGLAACLKALTAN
jgi:hypothetical protein